MDIRALALLLLLAQVVLAQQPTPILPDPNLTPGSLVRAKTSARTFY